MKPLLESLFTADQTIEVPTPWVAGSIPGHAAMAEVVMTLAGDLNDSAVDNADFLAELRGAHRQLQDDVVAALTDRSLNAQLLEVVQRIERLVVEKESRDRARSNQLTSRVDALCRELRAAQEREQSDALTGVLNRGAFDTLIQASLQRAAAESVEFSLLIFDLDDFKAINDRHGHLVGDEALRVFASRCQSHLRRSDHLARFGGEEFVVLMDGVPLAHAIERAQKICEAIAATPITVRRGQQREQLSLTVSAGVSSWASGDSAKAVIERADKALYHAKSCGKNCAMSEHDLVH